MNYHFFDKYVACLLGSAFLLCTCLVGSPSFRLLGENSFVVENDYSSFLIEVDDGVVRLVKQTRKDIDSVLAFEQAFFFDERTDLQFFESEIREESLVPNRVTQEHLRVGVYLTSETLKKKLIFRLYPESPVLACDAYFQGAFEEQVTDGLSLFWMRTAERHWRYRAVEFFDRTDFNNNLVREEDILGYQHPQRLSGNILLANNLSDGSSFLLLKEAPSSFSQIRHKGYDFDLTKYGLDVVGVGFGQSDLEERKWTKAYSIAFSATGSSELEQLSTLRSYQKSIRPHDRDWDEMIMMNTWGDRSRDASVGEAFVKGEVDACRRLGITHLQIDDGWQQGLSKNSSVEGSSKWDEWDLKDWEPHGERFPNGFEPVVEYAKAQGVTLGLWFAPSSANSFANWEQDSRVLIGLNRKYGIRYFKIDGIRLPDKLAEENLRKLYSRVLEETNYDVFFNVDATADARAGFHFIYEYGGNIFLENRYTTFAKYYYPYQTLRNLWMLSKYVPAERFQIEFLNKWKNTSNYYQEDVFAPVRVPFEYAFAVTMAAQPLAWFEGTGLPDEAFSLGELVRDYSEVRMEFHEGMIFPVGEEPCGRCWTGFQSIRSKTEGFLLIYRELNDESTKLLNTYLEGGGNYRFTKILGEGEILSDRVSDSGQVEVSLPDPHGFLMVRYELKSSI